MHAIMKTMCPAGYHHNCFMTTHALWPKCMIHHVPKCVSCHKAIVVITESAHYIYMYIYMYVYVYIYIYIFIHIYDVKWPF